ncbi:MAG: IclR family transcriptional regulator [Rubrivivax sp.]
MNPGAIAAARQKTRRANGAARRPEVAGAEGRAGKAEKADAADGGSQGIRRIFAILRVVAAEHGRGLRLSEIAARAQLHLATTHRLLRSLGTERAVVYDPFSRLYHIGHDFLQQEHETLDQRLRNHFSAAVQRVSDLTHDSVFLSARHGDDALYIHSVHGDFPAGELPLDVGGRRPLGVGAGSLCLLAALPAREQMRTVEANEERYLRYGSTAHDVRAKLRAYRRDGHAFDGDTVVPGLSGVGVPLYDDQGAVVAAMSLLSTNDRLSPERQQQAVRWMRSEAAQVGEFAARAAPRA